MLWFEELPAVVALFELLQSLWFLILEECKMVQHPAMFDILAQIKSTPDLITQPSDEFRLVVHTTMQPLQSLP